MTRLAYIVQETSEWTGDIIFAKSPIEARKVGANEFNDGELAGMSVKRAPWADKHLGKGVPARELIHMGWHFENCPTCGVRLEEDALRDAGKSVDSVVGTTGGQVYCCGRCLWRDMKQKARLAAEGKRAIEAFKAVVSARFPEATFCDEDHPWRGHHAYVNEGPRGGFHWRQVVVAFTLPCLKHGAAHYRVDDDYRQMVGPRRPHFTCCGGDREAFEAYAAATRRGK